MSGPTLPTELLIKITALAAPVQPFDFLKSSWASQNDSSTLHALSLTSRTFNQLAMPRLYGDLVVRTAEAGRALVRTLGSDEWQTGERAGEAGEWVKAVTCGQLVEPGEKAEGSFAFEVLLALKGIKLERVALVGLKLSLGGCLHLNSEQLPHSFGP